MAICLIALPLIQLATGCDSDSTIDNYSESLREVKLDLDTNVIKHQENSIIDSVTCLDVTFIENLESSWTSGYKDPRLAKKGFSYETTRTIEYGKEKTFENYTSQKQLKISNVEYPDGETFFTVKYQVTSEQMECLEKSLPNSYVKTNSDKYLKKGLGSYAEKLITCDSKSLWVTYTHRVGKELSMPAPNFDTIKLTRNATNIN